MAKANYSGASTVDSSMYVIEYDEFPANSEGEEQRRAEIREILAQMFIRARKRGRPTKPVEELKDVAA